MLLKGHLVLALATHADLTAWAVTTEVIRNEIAKLTTPHAITSAKYQLKLLACHALVKASEIELVAQSMAEIFAKLDALEMQNDATESSSKRRKIDDITLEDSNASNTQNNSSHLGFFANRSDAVEAMDVDQNNTTEPLTYKRGSYLMEH